MKCIWIYLLTNDVEYAGITADDHYARYDEPDDEKGGFRGMAPLISSYGTSYQLWIVLELTFDDKRNDNNENIAGTVIGLVTSDNGNRH